MGFWNKIYSKLKPATLESIAYFECNGDQKLLEKVKSKSRKAELVELRQKITKKALEKGYKTVEIAQFLNRHHSTISHYKHHYQ